MKKDKPAMRRTIQKALILEAVRKLKSHPTAEEVYCEIAAEHPNISRGTVYRNLQRLCEMNEIHKREMPCGPDHYDHLCHDHYHARCERCGRVVDIDMEYIKDLSDSVKDLRGFTVTGHDIVFRGICRQCAESSGFADT